MSMSTGPIAAGWPDESAEAGAVRRRRTIILGVIAAVLAIIVAVATVIVLATHDSGRSADLSLVAETSTGDDPFSPSVSLTNKPLRNDVRLATTTGTYTGRGVRAVAGTTTGLYGGTENSTCDVAKLANFLSENPDKARAWSGVFGISRSEIPYYLDSLTPVVLTSDTWVTNHSYAGGEATPFQAILQAGTAVLVDDAGVPRVRCSCGNPLAPSASAPLARYNVTGNRWKGYQPTSVVYVSYNTTNNNTTNVSAPAGVAPTPAALSLVNTDTASTLMRTVGGLLDLAGLPPLAAPLPTAASLNVPFRSDDAAVQSANGVGSRAVALAESASLEAPAPAPAQARSQEGASNQAAPSAADPNLAAPVPTTAAAPAPSSAAAAPPAAPSPGAPVPETIPSTPAAAPPSPTSFTGSGSSVVALTFTAAGGVPVSCTVPEPVAETTPVETTTPSEVPTTTTETTTEAPVETTTTEPTVTEAPTAIVVPSSTVTVTLSCNSPVVYTADISDLTSAAATSATGSDGIWTAPLEADGVRAATPIATATYGR